MTLYRQLILAIAALFLVLTVGKLALTIKSSHQNYKQLLSSQASDAALSLGEALSVVMDFTADNGRLEMLKAVIDRRYAQGQFKSIRYKRFIDGEKAPESFYQVGGLSSQSINTQTIKDESESSQTMEALPGGSVNEAVKRGKTVPRWFAALFPLGHFDAAAEVLLLRERVGVVEVSLDTSGSQLALWKLFVNEWLFLAVVSIACFLALFIGFPTVMRPLKRIERQMDAVSRREFSVQGQLPHIPELRSLAVAVNRMVFKVRAMFQEQMEISEGLHRQAHLDEVTGVSNRRDFDARFEAFLNSENAGGAGALFLLHIKNFEALNIAFGRESGDACLRQVADHFIELLAEFSGVIVSRRAGTDFAAFVPMLSENEIRALSEQLYQRVAASTDLQGNDLVQTHLGVVYSPAVTLQTRLLAEADITLAEAQQHYDSGWVFRALKDTEESFVRDSFQWKMFLEHILKKEDALLHFQPVRRQKDLALKHLEVLCRVRDGDQLLSASDFWPWVERHQLQSDFDRLILEKVMECGLQYSDDVKFSINISTYSIQDIAFIDWLVGYLKESPNFAKRLVVELSELVIRKGDDSLILLFSRLQELGVKICMSGFGAGRTSFGYLRSLPLAYLKVHSDIVRGIDENKDNQFFVKSLIQIAHECDIELLGEGVETELEWYQLSSMGIDGGQGYWLDKPSPVVVQD